tara:strand:- start:1520 stop:1816 length:297 start_codon:yes stop_codon:yes gene_type:complete
MKKIIIIIILFLVLIIGFYSITGSIVDNTVTGKCIDTDNGKKIYEKGITKYTNRVYNYTDYCVHPGKIREHWCVLGNMAIRAKTLRCPGECIDGACVK